MAKSRNTTPTIVPGSTIRFEEPSSDRKKKSSVATVIVQEVQDVNPVSGFTSFLKEYAVVGLAIGFIVGIQAQELVRSLVTSFIDPAFQLLFRDKLQDRVFHLSFRDRDQAFYWGSFSRALIYFLFVLGAIFVLVKILNLDKFGKVSQAEVAKVKEKK